MEIADKRRVCDLAGSLYDESIGDREFAELEALLAHDSECREWYLHCVQQDALLGEQLTPQQTAPSRNAPGQSRGYFLAAAVLLVFSIGTFFVINTNTKPNRAIASQPTVEYFQDTVRLTYHDGTVAMVEQPARFRLDGNKRIRLESGKVVARQGQNDSDFEIAMASHTFRSRAGEFGVSLTDGDAELHVFDGEGKFESGLTSSEQKANVKTLASGSVYRIDSNGSLSPSLISNAAKFPSRLTSSGGGFGESFDSELSPPFSGWKGAWYSPEDGQTAWAITDSDPLTRKSGRFLSVSRIPTSEDGTHLIPWRGERRELQASHVRWSRQYGKTDSFSPNNAHTIEFLFRLDSAPKDVLRIAMFNGTANVELEPRPGARTWHIHAGVPPESLHDDDLVWFLKDDTREDRFQFMKLERGVTYRVFIEVAPKNRSFRCTISDGMNVIYNNNRRGLPTWSSGRQAMSGIHLFVWGKPGKECRFSVDEFLIRNTPRPTAIQP